MKRLRLTSCLSTNTEAAGRAVACYLEDRLRLPVDFVDDIPWDEREKRLDQGDIHAGWVCGLLYAWKFDQPERPVELLAAPIMHGRRYGNRPVYFSDIIVHRQSPYRTFGDLRGATCAYNETRSYSGYHLLRNHLAAIGETEGYFGRAVESGAHLASLDLVCRQEADTAAVDSTVLDWEIAQDPGLTGFIRIVQVLGPSPVPPWVAASQMPEELRHDIRQALLEMHIDREGRDGLASGRIDRFIAVTDNDYNPIRDVVDKAGRTTLS